ncbi:uncharacterized protein [Lolium perenne]|jgi:hypothetical protein|uniref:uncharacterized protein n=1 Tax=Lolium perenne TaxID=4522 RepID=UPI0021F67D0B|nr:uncharacterized protein LOC127348950 [Lolium perenne]
MSAGAGAAAPSGGKVVMADGSMRALIEPVSVAELMMDHPRHFVVDARVLQHRKGGAGGGARKVAPLPADHVLGTGGLYVLLPATRGKVSADEARSKSMPGRLMRKMSSRRAATPMDQPAKHEAATAAAVAEMERREEPVPTETDGFEEHRPEFLSRELSCRGWKPSLNTIEERVMPKKVSHWLF